MERSFSLCEHLGCVYVLTKPRLRNMVFRAMGTRHLKWEGQKRFDRRLCAIYLNLIRLVDMSDMGLKWKNYGSDCCN